MKRTAKVALLVMAALLLTGGAGWETAGAERTEARQERTRMDTGELKQLHFLLGEWSYVNEYANGAKDTGTYSARLGPGGQSVITEFSGSGAAGEFTGLEVFTWNATAKQYETYAFLSLAPGCSTRTGQWEGDTLVFTRKGTGQELRYVYKKSGADSLTIELYMKAGEQPPKLLLTTRAHKPGSSD